jgi:hypothetical protein
MSQYKNKNDYYYIFKTQLGSRARTRSRLQVKLTINPSQYKDKNNYYNSFKTNSGVDPGLELGHELG